MTENKLKISEQDMNIHRLNTGKTLKQSDAATKRVAKEFPYWELEIYAVHHHICIYLVKGPIRKTKCVQEPNSIERCFGITMESKLKRAIRAHQKLCEGKKQSINWDIALYEGLMKWHHSKYIIYQKKCRNCKHK